MSEFKYEAQSLLEKVKKVFEYAVNLEAENEKLRKETGDMKKSMEDMRKSTEDMKRRYENEIRNLSQKK
jgi:hypothetical protein